MLLHHALVLTGNPVAPSGLATRFVAGLGEIAVDGFFVVSGFLVTRSLFGRSTVTRFFVARGLRIYPGLWVMLAVTALTLAMRSEAALLSDPATLSYFARNATALLVAFEIPGVFQANPVTAVNGSLWSLQFELSCYLALGIAGALGLARRKWLIPAGVVILMIVVVGTPVGFNFYVEQGARLGMYFGLGGCAAAFADRMPMRGIWLAGLILLALVLDFTLLRPIGWAITYAYGLLWVAHVPDGAIRHFNRLPDISYGLYIYAFPVQQLMIESGLGATPITNVATALPITALLATVSWYWVEEPALALKNRLGRKQDPRAGD